MRIVCISDTHSLHEKMYHEIPKGDLLLHSGDCTNVGKEKDVRDFIEWYKGINGFKYKIFISGNHDFAFEQEPPWLNSYIEPKILEKSNVFYLEDNSFEIIDDEFSRPIKIYGSPWQPEFFNWAFNLPRNGKVLKSRWDDIPNNTDILITHGPPHGIRDFVVDRSGTLQVGCELLRERINVLKPLLHVFGHIHGAYGAANIGEVTFANASTCNERYEPINKPLVFDLIENEGVFMINFIED
jgi:calcineurin-like phosphoesterase family protein